MNTELCLPGEVWKPIVGFEGLYEVSSLGRVRSAEGKTTSSAWAKTRVWKQRIIKQHVSIRARSRYEEARVKLWKDGKEYTFLTARLVAMAFCPGYREGLTVNHINGNPIDNRPENLEWITLKENIQHGFQHGLYAANQKPCTLIDPEGNKMTFCSTTQAAHYLGRGHTYIIVCLRNNRPIKHALNGRIYRVA